MQINRGDYGELYHRTFGKSMNRQACREGWRRWQKVWASGNDGMILHRPEEEPPPESASDYLIVLACGALEFRWRAAEDFFGILPDMWCSVLAGPAGRTLDPNPRKAARTFVHNAFVDGYVLNPRISVAIASGIAWLLSTSEMQIPIQEFHLLGYDITHVPGPAGQARMFNFRALLSQPTSPDALKQARSLPLPQWHPPGEDAS
jgi:hypothetical protein